ncbi:uncharacterized protein LOC113866877 [Abrus precatorius]|uniref:Uncharacterized protein LOC113866877 n=1 Tax=Abrus precatorius TaxID=3816 RepID=A0A8B8LM50_ABRPR|nr:uncharacterized protein LOC113866877 [Abrus precatorius]
MEKIFNAMGCREENKVAYATYLLCGEAENWWRFAGQTLPKEDGYVQWKAFKTIFLGNYFSRDLRKQKHGDGEEDLCAQFEHGLRPSIRAAVSVFQLTDLPTLVSKSRIFEANSRGKTVDTRGAGPVRQDRRPPRFSRGLYSGSNSSQSRESSSQERSSGSGSGSSSFRGPHKCFRLLDMLFDSGATHSFISVDCMKSLGLYVTELPCNVVVTTPMGMDWLAANHMLMDCREKTLIFGATVAKVPRLMSQGAWENMVNAKAFMVMFSMEAESVAEPKYILVVRDFLEVFLEDVSELPPKREIKFSIDLIPGASPISVAPYRMSLVELAEVKKQVQDLLQKRFVRSSVSP